VQLLHHPSLRGDLVSRPLDHVMREAETLVASGVRELLVISQDTSAYGSDIRYREVKWRNERMPRASSIWRAHSRSSVSGRACTTCIPIRM